MIFKNVKQKVEDYVHYHEIAMLNDRFMERLVECRDNVFSVQTKNDIIRNTIFRSPLQFVKFKLADALKDYDLR
jgi:hypothetical protein